MAGQISAPAIYILFEIYTLWTGTPPRPRARARGACCFFTFAFPPATSGIRSVFLSFGTTGSFPIKDKDRPLYLINIDRQTIKDYGDEKKDSCIIGTDGIATALLGIVYGFA